MRNEVVLRAPNIFLWQRNAKPIQVSWLFKSGGPLLRPGLLTPVLLILCFSLSFSSSHAQMDPASRWDLLYPKIRDRLCFPVKGYTYHSIGGKEGSGYQAHGYEFFDGNQHKGHPAHDIFIRDRDQNGLDDRTGKPVEVVAVSSGIAVSVNLGWKPSSPIQGGNYVWVYTPVASRYYYYAHLNEVSVMVGQTVTRGDRLGTVGRTGSNEYPSRSPTHLHFSVHHSVDGHPRPLDPYSELVKGCGK